MPLGAVKVYESNPYFQTSRPTATRISSTITGITQPVTAWLGFFAGCGSWALRVDEVEARQAAVASRSGSSPPRPILLASRLAFVPDAGEFSPVFP